MKYYIALGIFVFLWASMAFGTEYRKPSPVNQSQSQNLEQAQNQVQNQNQSQAAQGGNVALNSNANFRGYYMDSPGVDGDNCIGGGYGGGDNSNGAAFLGFNFIIDPCYFQSLAAQETNIDTVARLKCADRKYRAAVAYHIAAFRRAERRQYCIQRVTADEQTRIEMLRQAIVSEQRETEVMEAISK